MTDQPTSVGGADSSVTARIATKSTGASPADTLFMCGHVVSRERLEWGYGHCSRPACGVAWRRHRIEQERLALVLVPKQGFAWVQQADVAKSGRSSGRA